MNTDHFFPTFTSTQTGFPFNTLEIYGLELPTEILDEIESIDRNNSEMAVNRKAIKMFAETKAEAVEPSDYFYTLTDKRTGKFKGKYVTGKMDPTIIKIRQKRKAIETELSESVSKNLRDNITTTFSFHADKGTAIQELYFCSFGMPEMNESIKNIYISMYELLQNKLPLQFFIDFEKMTSDEASDILSRKRDPNFRKVVKDDYWKRHKSLIYNLINTYWSSQSLSINGKLQTIREYYQHLTGEDVNVNILASSLIGLIWTDQKIINKKLNTEYLIVTTAMLSIITKELNETKLHFLEKKNELISQLNKAFLDVDGVLYLESLVKAIEEKEVTKNGFNTLITIRKEQKQHSYARFFNLINYYTAFVNSVKILSEVSEIKETGFKKITMNVILEILENCHIELTDRSKSNKLKKTVEELEALITILPDGHRDQNVMGREKKGSITPVEKKNVVELLNVILGTYKNEKPIKCLERAHTLPFPACFAWDDTKIVTFISNATEKPLQREKKGILLLENVQVLKQNEIFLNKGLFVEMSRVGKDHEEIEALFSDQFNEYSKSIEDPIQFLYLSLGLLRKFYLKLFSETAFLPDFVNEEMDSISEWRKKDEESNFKISLKQSLQELIKNDCVSTKSDVASSLKPFFKESAASAIQVHNKLFSDQSEYTLLKRVLVHQVEESMRLAIHEIVNEALKEEIFPESTSKDLIAAHFHTTKKNISSESKVIAFLDDSPVDYNPDLISLF